MRLVLLAICAGRYVQDVPRDDVDQIAQYLGCVITLTVFLSQCVFDRSSSTVNMDV